jgi:hypothetical protein
MEQVLTRAGKTVEELLEEFFEWGKEMGKRCKAWQFWFQFVTVDVQSYIGLYFAIRSGNWTLRTASWSQLSPFYLAWDRTHYQHIGPQHRAHLRVWAEEAPELLEMLEAGGFAASRKGNPFRNQAMDELQASKLCISFNNLNSDDRLFWIRAIIAFQSHAPSA